MNGNRSESVKVGHNLGDSTLPLWRGLGSTSSPEAKVSFATYAFGILSVSLGRRGGPNGWGVVCLLVVGPNSTIALVHSVRDVAGNNPMILKTTALKSLRFCPSFPSRWSRLGFSGSSHNNCPFSRTIDEAWPYVIPLPVVSRLWTINPSKGYPRELRRESRSVWSVGIDALMMSF